MSTLRLEDPQIADAIQNEVRRQRENINLIASENYASRAVLEAQGSALTNKYAEGYPGRRYYGGCEFIDVAERLAIQRALSLFGADHANVQPHSGAQANMAAYFASLRPGDTVMGLSLDHGGHLTHGSPGELFVEAVRIRTLLGGPRGGADRLRRGRTSRQAALAQADRHGGDGLHAHHRLLTLQGDRGPSGGASLMVDMAHIAGLVAAGEHPTPVGEAQIITSTTHKTLRGPRGGMILSSKEMARSVDRAVFPNAQGGPLEHVVAAKAVAFARGYDLRVRGLPAADTRQRGRAGRVPGGGRTSPCRRGNRQPHGTCGPATAGV